MDDETKFWIAEMVADHKGTSDFRPMYQDAIKLTGKKPKMFNSDGANNFHIACKEQFYSNKRDSKHIRHITLKDDHNNNKMERIYGETRDREKVMRGLRNKDTPIIKGYQIFHNFVRPHEALEGKTPADACCIEAKGENNWITTIQNVAIVG